MVYRTYSSPSLARDSPMEMDEGSYDFIVGDRVYVDGYKPGAIAYIGEVKFAAGDWAGIALEDPLGKHNGVVHGTEYFQCEPLHGIFVRMHRLTRYPTGTTTKSSSRVHYDEPTTAIPTSNLGAAGGRSSSASSRRSAMKSPSTTRNFYDMNPSNWYNTSNTENSRNYDGHQTRSLSRDSYDSQGYKSRDYSPDIGKSTMTHKFSSSRTPTPTPAYDEQKYSSLRRQSSALANRLSSRTNSDLHDKFTSNRSRQDDTSQHLLTPKTKNVADAFVPTYRRAPTPDSSLRLGSRVVVNSSQGALTGILRYVGQCSFASGEWAGVELDEPLGKNDGSVRGRRYFICPKDYGLFAPIFKVGKEYSPSSPTPARNTSSTSPKYKDARSYSSLSDAPKPIRRPIFTSMQPRTATPGPTPTKTTPITTINRTTTTTTKTRDIPITREPIGRHRSSLSRMSSDFDDFGGDFEIERLTPSSPTLDNYYSATKSSSSYSSRQVDYSDMY